MNKCALIPALALALAAITVAPAFGGLSAPASLLDLAYSSDLIVSGSADGIAQSGSAAVIALTVNRVVKGDPTVAGTTISVNWELRMGGFVPGVGHVNFSLPANPNGLWFLRGAPGGWLLASVWNGEAPLAWTFIPQPAGPLPPAYAYASDATVADKVAAEASFGMENAAIRDLRMEQMEPLLDTFHSTYVQTLYQRLSVSDSAPRQIEGLAGLIRAGSPPALATAVKSAALFAGYPVEYGLLLLSISGGFRAADPASVAALGQAAVSPDMEQPFRVACAHALGAIRSAAALPYLATLLDDPDDTLRIEAIGGFSAFANGLPMRTEETIAHFAMGEQAISRNEAGYLAFWKGWWSRYGADLSH